MAKVASEGTGVSVRRGAEPFVIRHVVDVVVSKTDSS